MKNLYHIIFTAIIICGLTACDAVSQKKTGSGQFTVKQLQEDLQVMRSRLESLHPGLYEYTPKPKMDAYFDSLKKVITKPLSELQFLRLIKPFLYQIKDGHTNIYPSAEAVRRSESQRKFIPIGVSWLGKHLYLREVITNQVKIPIGSDILAINQQPVKEILEAFLYKYTSRDGYNETFPRYLVSRAFSGAYYWYINQADTFEIKYKTSSGEIKKAILPAINVQQLNQFYAQNPRPTPDKMLEFKELENSTGYVRVSSFATDEISNRGQSFQRFVEESFRTVAEKKLKNIILDLRGNGGGDDGLGAYIYAYLTNKPFKYYKTITALVKNIEDTQYLEDGVEYFNSLVSHRLRSLPNGRYLVKRWPGLKRTKPRKKHRFKGKLYVLLDGGSFSSTTEFASIIHYHKRATFVGEETGGNYYTNTSGIMPRLVLPNTNIRVRMGLLQYRTAVSGYAKGRGIIPDYLVKYTIQDVLQNKDKGLEKTLELIKGGK